VAASDPQRPESLVAWTWKVYSARARFDPVGIEAVELVAEAQPRRCDELERGVIEFEIAVAWSDRDRLFRIDRPAIHDRALDVRGRRRRHRFDPRRIDNYDALGRGKPQMSIA
jgi:hypothetical protein